MNATNWKKWGARTIVALGGLLTMWLTTGSWDQEESLMAVTIGVAALTSLLVPADEDVKQALDATGKRQ